MKVKRVAYVFLAMALALGSVGCGSRSSKTEGKSLVIWAEASTVKYKQDDDGEAVKTAKDKEKLQIHMAKNESEGVQLMMYAKKDVDSYQVSVSDLKGEKGVISAKDIDIYVLKYQQVQILQETANDAFPVGCYVPDPMLPMETAIEYKENTVKKGNNQAVFLDVPTQKDTPAGIYEGEVILKTDDETYKMPLEVTVYDVDLPDTPGLKTAFSFLDRDHFATAELDASDEMTATYVDTLLEYNMGSSLPVEENGGIERYIELLREYYNKPGFTSYRIYYDPSGAVYNGVECAYNVPLLKEYIRAIAQASVEDQINYFEKAYCYFYTVADEPTSDAAFTTAEQALDIYKQMLTDCDAELRYQYAGTDDLQYYESEISQSLIEIPDVLPGALFKGQMDEYNLHDYVLCPLISNFQSEANRKLARQGREDKELWTYSCNFPVYPYPTSHVDDWCLGFRLTSWMCCDYEFDGFLQWRSVGYIHGVVGGDAVDDPWEMVNTSAGRPGDGVYLYPGAKYGLDKPCPSLRAMAYRDGTEDYEVLKAVEKIYQEYGMDASCALQEIYDQVYQGVIPITDTYVFEDVRLQLFEMINDLRSDHGILYQDITIGFDTAEVTFKSVNEKATASVDDKEIQKEEDGFYHATIDLKKQDSCTIQISCGEDSKKYTRKLTDGVLGTLCDFEDGKSADKYVVSSKKTAKIDMNQDEKYAYQGERSLHLVLNDEKEDVIPYFAIEKNGELIGGSWKDISGMRFYVYNASSEDINMEAVYFTSQETAVDTYLLEAGEWNLVEVKMPTNLKDIDSIKELDFNFSKGSSAELFIDNFVTITKGEK